MLQKQNTVISVGKEQKQIDMKRRTFALLFIFLACFFFIVPTFSVLLVKVEKKYQIFESNNVVLLGFAGGLAGAVFCLLMTNPADRFLSLFAGFRQNYDHIQIKFGKSIIDRLKLIHRQRRISLFASLFLITITLIVYIKLIFMPSYTHFYNRGDLGLVGILALEFTIFLPIFGFCYVLIALFISKLNLKKDVGRLSNEVFLELVQTIFPDLKYKGILNENSNFINKGFNWWGYWDSENNVISKSKDRNSTGDKQNDGQQKDASPLFEGQYNNTSLKLGTKTAEYLFEDPDDSHADFDKRWDRRIVGLVSGIPNPYKKMRNEMVVIKPNHAMTLTGKPADGGSSKLGQDLFKVRYDQSLPVHQNSSVYSDDIIEARDVLDRYPNLMEKVESIFEKSEGYVEPIISITKEIIYICPNRFFYSNVERMGRYETGYFHIPKYQNPLNADHFKYVIYDLLIMKEIIDLFIDERDRSVQKS